MTVANPANLVIARGAAYGTVLAAVTLISRPELPITSALAELLTKGPTPVVSYPTDLTAQEQQVAQRRLRELADKFTADGALRTPQWREVFQRTWRHPYVPIYYPELADRHGPQPGTEGKRLLTGGENKPDHEVVAQPFG